ncbi:MAG: aldehyde dehydrogenase family protein, partial [Chloroflexota bacterium]
MNHLIDLVIPRGGAGLIKSVAEQACMPVVTGGIGVCHTYIDKAADVDKAVAICYNAKVQRPTVCNALDAILVHKDIAATALPKIASEWAKAGVEMHCDERAFSILENPREIPGTGFPVAWSKRYSEMPFLYWWTITPRRLKEIEKSGRILFGEKDSRNLCVVFSKDIIPLLTPERQVERENPAWHIKLFPEHPHQIVVEGTSPASPAQINVKWLPYNELIDLKLKPAAEEDWGREFLALIAAVKVVDSLDEALGHIERYGSGHSEAIITEDYTSAMRFLNEVDAACVYVNASTRFTDGGQFGLGAEVGISTQKFHARGPLGLRELTSYKWLIFGSGQVRP